MPTSGTESPLSAARIIYEVSPHSSFFKEEINYSSAYVWTLGGYLTRLLSFFLYEIHEVGAVIPFEWLGLFLVSAVIMPCFQELCCSWGNWLNLYLARWERPKSRKRREISRWIGFGDSWWPVWMCLFTSCVVTVIKWLIQNQAGFHQEPGVY